MYAAQQPARQMSFHACAGCLEAPEEASWVRVAPQKLSRAEASLESMELQDVLEHHCLGASAGFFYLGAELHAHSLETF